MIKKTGKILKFECNLFESQMCVRSTQHEHAARSHLRPGSRASLRALEALGVFMCFYKIVYGWVPGYPKTFNFGHLVPEITKNTQAYIQM